MIATGGNVADLVRAAAMAQPAKPALLYGEQRMSWSELDATVDGAAAGLVRLGLRPGERIGVRLGNTPDFVAAYFGALRAGLVVVPVGTRSTARELRQAMDDSGARALVVDRAAPAEAREMRGGALEHVLVCGVQAAPEGALAWRDVLRRDTDDRPVEPAGGGEALAVLLYTSGTSGRPKGAMLTHRALLANLEQGARIDPPAMTPDDVALLVLPLFHVYGLNAALGAVAFHGATGLLIDRFEPSQTLQEMTRHGVTNVVGAPPMYLAWADLPEVTAAFSTVRMAISGAAPLPADVQQRFARATGLQVFEGYGLTETAPVLSSTLMSAAAKPGSIGRALPGVELRLVDADGAPSEDGDPGEVVARGANLFSGYWPDGAGGPDEDGWWPTGDVAYADDDGDLRLVDRTTELILVSGFNVYPREVEDVLVQHPDIEEAAVLGIAHPYTGESVKALVVLRPGARLSVDEIFAHAARSLARFKCPMAVELVAALPHGATGKVRKGRLRELQG